ncbi:hypothetical protein L7F22_054703 [Adiantum nelumboides]|nr:hypothetical protein [Adiantum nelumboides]
MLAMQLPVALLHCFHAMLEHLVPTVSCRLLLSATARNATIEATEDGEEWEILSSQWIIPYQEWGMTTGKIESLWKCMMHPFMVTQGDIRSIFVADLVCSDVRRDNTAVTDFVDESACVQDNGEAKALPDFQPGDPFIPLIFTTPMSTIAG